MLKKKFTLEKDRKQLSLRERIFPSLRAHVTTKVSSDTKYGELITQQAKEKDPTSATRLQGIVEKAAELKSKQADRLQPHREERILNNMQHSLSYNNKHVSLLEMWNVIESIGIKREILEKVFTTDEAVSELYYVIAKRIHHDREQEMIKRLRAHIEKRKEANLNLDPLDSHPVAVAVGGFNSGGREDLVAGSVNRGDIDASNGVGVSTILGDGTGSFGPVTHFVVATIPDLVLVGNIR